MRRTRCNLAAFSLLELILAMSMASMLAMSLYLSMSIALRAKTRASAAVEPARIATIAMDLLKQDLQSVLPPTGVFAGPFVGFHQANADADADWVTFYCIGSDGTHDDQPLSEGIRRIELGLRTDVTPTLLVRRITRNLLPFIEVEPQEEILCRNVHALRLRYFDGSTWLDDWDSTMLGDVLPAAVEVTIELANSQTGNPGNPGYRVMSIIPLACSKPPDSSQMGVMP